MRFRTERERMCSTVSMNSRGRPYAGSHHSSGQPGRRGRKGLFEGIFEGFDGGLEEELHYIFRNFVLRFDMRILRGTGSFPRRRRDHHPSLRSSMASCSVCSSLR